MNNVASFVVVLFLILLNKDNLFFILLSNSTIVNKHNSFTKLTKDEILNKNYWISKMFKESLYF